MSSVIGYMLVSFLLDGIVSMIIPLNSLFRPLFSFLGIFLIYPFYYYQQRNYFITVFLFGLFYDIVYTNTLFFHALLNLFFGFLILLWNRRFRIGIGTILWVGPLLIFLYRLFSYLLLLFLQQLSFDLSYFFHIVVSSFVANILYLYAGYFCLEYLSKRKKIHKIS